MRADRMQRWRSALAHAFAVEQGGEAPSPEDLALLDRIAGRIARRGLAAPALLFLETFAPLSFLGSQALHALTPLLELVGDARDAERLAALLERREAVGLLQARIEAAAATSAPPGPAAPPGPGAR